MPSSRSLSNIAICNNRETKCIKTKSLITFFILVQQEQSVIYECLLEYPSQQVTQSSCSQTPVLRWSKLEAIARILFHQNAVPITASPWRQSFRPHPLSCRYSFVDHMTCSSPAHLSSFLLAREVSLGEWLI